MKFEPKTLTYYEFFPMFRHIEEKYGIDLHNVKGKYCNFWHWLLDYWDGQFEWGKPFSVDWEDVYVYAEKQHKQWVIDVVKLFHTEFSYLGKHNIVVDC